MAAATLALSGCAILRPAEHSRITAGPDGFRTFNPVLEIDGTPMLCAAFGLINPVHGALAGQQGAREPAWLLTDDGRLISVVFPQGFLVRFEPEATLYNGSAQIARAGEDVELSQTAWPDAEGTYEDPYIASGIVFNGCYPFVE